MPRPQKKMTPKLQWLLERLTVLWEDSGLSEAAFLKSRGLHKDVMRTMRAGTQPTLERLVEIAKALGYETVENLLANSPHPADTTNANGQLGMMRVVEADTRRGAGRGEKLSGSDQETATNVVALRGKTEWVVPVELTQSVTLAPPDRLRIMPVIGGHMKPQFHPGQKVMVDLTDTTPSPPGIFSVDEGYGSVVRLVEHIPHTDPPRVRVAAIDSHFKEYERPMGDVKIEGRVIGTWHLT